MRTPRVGLLLLAMCLPAFAADQWLRATSPHFELFTTSGEKKAREATLYFEQVRAFFLKASPVKPPGEFPVCVIAFHDPAQFQSYSYNPIVLAYYTSTLDRDYIVMQDPAPANYRIAIHEYTHLVIRHSGLRIPVWLNEGWADVFSTMRTEKNGVAVGDLIDSRVKVLSQQSEWLNFAQLTSVTIKSPDYNEAERASMFYAESWALVHMLYLSPEYEKGFPKFITSLNRGNPVAAACREAWGKSGDEIMADLKTYFARKRLFGRIFLTAPETPEDKTVLSTPASFDTDLMLADLIAAINRPAAAQEEYTRLAKLEPTRAEIPTSQGFLALQGMDKAAARANFERAFAMGSTDAQMCFHLAMLQREAGERPERYLASVERAVKAKPDFLEFRIQFGLMQVDARQFAAAIDTLMAIDTLPPDRASPVFSGLAYSYLQTGDLVEARAKAETAQKWARTQPELQVLEKLSTLIDARSKGKFATHPGEKLQRVLGRALSIECAASGARFHVQVATYDMALDLPDAAAIEFVVAGGRAVNLGCGPLNGNIAVEYATPGVGSGSVGIVRRLELQ